MVQLIDSLGCINHAISILDHWILASNYEKEMFLAQESLEIIFYPSIGELLIATFQYSFYVVRYSWAPGHLKKG